jgi:hypothetical protein
MKPSTSEAMRQLIAQIRQAIPFDTNLRDVCSEDCRGCSMKLLEYLDSELESWEYRLDQHEVPDFRDLSKLERSGRKIYQALQKNGIISSSQAK